MKTRITELLGIEYPILQGGMAWVSDATLAAAVSNAGGAGIIAGGSRDAESLRAEIQKCKSLTDKPFGLNVMLMSPHSADIAAMLCEEKIAFVTTGAGNPAAYIPAWKEAGIKVIPVIPTVALAKRMERSGADALVAEGMEAGGHIGEQTTMCLLPQVADAVEIPVIGAGGIADSRGVKAAFILGAEGVQVGTRFLASAECTIHENYKSMVVGAKDTDSAVTGRSTGHPVRQIKNRFTKNMVTLEKDGVDPMEFETHMIGSLRKAAVDGNETEGSFMAGQIAGLVKDVKSCKEIIEELFA